MLFRSGLDSRCLRIREPYLHWIDADFPEVLSLRKKYYEENAIYHMMAMDASKAEQIEQLPSSRTAIVILEGLSMYLTDDQMRRLLQTLAKKYSHLHILMDVYTAFGARISKYKNPVNDLGVTELHGTDKVQCLLSDTKIQLKAEHSFTPNHLINALKPWECVFFRAMFAERVYRKIYRLYELEIGRAHV